MSAAAPDSQPRRIFVSYARRDAAALAQRLYNHFQGSAWLDKYAIEPGVLWTRAIDDALESADVVLALLTNGSYESNMCTAEHIKAMDLGKRIIPLLHQPNARIPTYLAATQYIDFTNPDSGEPWRKLQLAVSALLPAKAVALTAQPAPRQTLVTAPPLLRNYLHRADAITSLRRQIVTDDPGPSIALTALHGMGGIGKTVLAQALAHDEVVQNAFPDGIVWITVGREPTNDTFVRLQEVRRALGDKPDPSENLTTCQNLYRTVLRDKAALVIVDDVWHTRDIEPFLAEAPRSKILFTTRDETIANGTQAQLHHTGLLTPNQSRGLLAKSSGLPLDKLPKEAGDLIRECGHLPLAISMIGAMLRNKPAPFWPHVLHLLRTADIVKVKAQFPNYPHPNLFRAIQVSVDQLEPEDRTRYLSLAVLLEDMRIAPYIQRTLWNVDEFEALETREQLVSLSLAQREGDDSIRLHDLQMDYLRSQYPGKQALDLIHGALRLSSHILDSDPTQFASQLVGRLLPYLDNPPIAAFTAGITQSAPRPWLRPLQPALHPPGTALVRTLFGHTDSVRCVAITPDGNTIVSGSSDSTIAVWDARSGRRLRVLIGHSSWVHGVVVTPDGTRILSACADNTLKVWHIDSDIELLTLVGHTSHVNSVAIAPDSARAISASDDHTLKVWDLYSGRELLTFSGHKHPVTNVTFTPDGTRVVSGCADGSLTVWDAISGCEIRTFGRPQEVEWGVENPALGLAITPDGSRAVVGRDSAVRMYDLLTGLELLSWTAHVGNITGVGITPNGNRVVSACDDGTLKFWDLRSRTRVASLSGHSGGITNMVITPDGSHLVTASHDRTLRMWDLTCNRVPPSRTPTSDQVRWVAVSQEAGSAMCLSRNGRLTVRNLDRHAEPLCLASDVDQVISASITPSAHRAVTISESNEHKTIQVWDLESGQEIKSFPGDSFYSIAVVSHGSAVVLASQLQCRQGYFANDGKLIPPVSEVSIWSLDLDLITELGHQSGCVVDIAISPDGTRAVSASSDGTLKTWDLVSLSELLTLRGHTDFINSVTITPDGTHVVSGSRDRMLKIWDLNSGKERLTLSVHSGHVKGAVSSDGAWAISSADTTLKMWSVTTGALLATFTADAFLGRSVATPGNVIRVNDTLGYIHYLRLED